jgi:hypothetical protein
MRIHKESRMVRCHKLVLVHRMKEPVRHTWVRRQNMNRTKATGPQVHSRTERVSQRRKQGPHRNRQEPV